MLEAGCWQHLARLANFELVKRGSAGRETRAWLHVYTGRESNIET